MFLKFLPAKNDFFLSCIVFESVTVFMFIILFTGARRSGQPELINKVAFDKELNGKKVALFTLKNSNGLVVQITNYGSRVVSLWLPDKKGNFDDVVLGYSTLEGYLESNELYYGATVGRYASYIANGRFMLNGIVYNLARNNGPNHLHGGVKGFNSMVWDATQSDESSVVLNYLSQDMEEGYPGNLNTKVRYELTDSNEIRIQYWATTDKATPVNLTHHSFFNLKGAGAGNINDHLLQINSDFYTPMDPGMIPTGEIATVEGTPFDFRTLILIGQRISQDHEQLNNGLGYDHNWVLNSSHDELNFAARVLEPASGRLLEVFTNEPCLQFYGGNFLDGKDKGKRNKIYSWRSALCLETQHYPDSPNQQHFPSAILIPGKEYYSICVYRFGVRTE
jgi:aldose 1-epimerase